MYLVQGFLKHFSLVFFYMQLGFESRTVRGGPESVKQSVFKPVVINTLTQLEDTARHSREEVCVCIHMNMQFVMCMLTPKLTYILDSLAISLIS